MGNFVIPFVLLMLSFVIRSQWGVKDSNLRRHCHQIYSLTPLTTRETPLADPMTNDEIQMTTKRALGRRRSGELRHWDFRDSSLS